MVNGQQQKTLLNDQKAQSGGREGRVKERVVDKEKQNIKSTASLSARWPSSTQRPIPKP